jgi:zinc protease
VLPFAPLTHVYKESLPNGLRILLKPDRRAPLVSVQAWVRVGSVDEAANDAGLSHVLEHMVFKGTRRHTAAEISRWVEAAGGSLNAETAKEYTHYYIDVPKAGASKAVQLLGQLLHGATLDEKEWARECPVILEEIKRRHDDPDALLWDLLNEALFEDVRWQRPVIGYPATVEKVTAEGLQRFYRDHYLAGQSLLVVSGDFDRREMMRWVRRAFSDMPSGTRSRTLPEKVAARSRGAKSVRKPVKQSYLALGFETPPSAHPDHEALDLLATVMGDGASSRLVHSLRERRKLVWNISAANLTYEGPGVFAIFVECDPKKRSSAQAALKDQLHELRRQPPSKAELARAKNVLQTAWLQGFETMHHQAATLGLFAIDDHLERLAGYLPRILAITQRQMAEAIERYLHPDSVASALIEA